MPSQKLLESQMVPQVHSPGDQHSLLNQSTSMPTSFSSELLDQDYVANSDDLLASITKRKAEIPEAAPFWPSKHTSTAFQCSLVDPQSSNKSPLEEDLYGLKTDTKDKKKLGRKPVDDMEITRRKAQNRAAQRAFRERKEKYVRDLEIRVKELEMLTTSAHNKEPNLEYSEQKRVQQLKEENERLKEIINRLKIENEALKATDNMSERVTMSSMVPQFPAQNRLRKVSNAELHTPSASNNSSDFESPATAVGEVPSPFKNGPFFNFSRSDEEYRQLWHPEHSSLSKGLSSDASFLAADKISLAQQQEITEELFPGLLGDIPNNLNLLDPAGRMSRSNSKSLPAIDDFNLEKLLAAFGGEKAPLPYYSHTYNVQAQPSVYPTLTSNFPQISVPAANEREDKLNAGKLTENELDDLCDFFKKKCTAGKMPHEPRRRLDSQTAALLEEICGKKVV